MRLIYGYDALCGWCYGFAPAFAAFRAARPDIPVRLVQAGLVTGARVGPYAEAEAYIRQAAPRMAEVTGRAVGADFWTLIRDPAVISDSAPPGTVIAAIAHTHPDHVLALADALLEAHFLHGRDLNRPETYAAVFAQIGLDASVPPLDDTGRAEAAWAEGRALGVASFPTLILETASGREVLPSLYSTDGLLAAFDDAAARLGRA